MEYVKEPKDIDNAVYKVVNFLETRKRTHPDGDKRRPARVIRKDHDEEEVCTHEDDSVILTVGPSHFSCCVFAQFGVLSTVGLSHFRWTHFSLCSLFLTHKGE